MKTTESIDISSHTWRVIKAVAIAEIETLRKMNDNIDLDAIKTAGIRGRIAAWTSLLDLEEDLKRK